MKTVDIILLIILGLGAIQGFRKGLIMEIVSIVAFVLAIIGGFQLLHTGIDLLRDYFHLAGKMLPYLSFLIIFIGIIILINLLGKAVNNVLDMTLLRSFDNFVGAVLGIVKWTFGLSVLIWIFTYFEINILENYVDNTIIYPMVSSFAPKVVEYIAVFLPFADDIFSSVEKISLLVLYL